MFKIISHTLLGGTTAEMVVEAPLVARKAKAGQFLIIRIDEEGERVPLTIADHDSEKGTITMVYQIAGRSTKQLSFMKEGEALADVVGPLGMPSEVENFGTVVIVGGGVGIAPIYPIAKALKEAGNRVISIIGAKTKDLLFWEDKMREASTELLIATDDGSVGHRGFVTDLLDKVTNEEEVKVVWAVGPMIMMRSCVNAIKPKGIKIFVSMNPVMIDGTGMCGCCRVKVGDETRFACVEGPEFDGALVDFDLAMNRARFMKDLETRATEEYDHDCNIGLH